MSSDLEYTYFFDRNYSSKVIELLWTTYMCFSCSLLFMYLLRLYINALLSLAIIIHTAFICIYFSNFVNIVLYVLNVRIKILLVYLKFNVRHGQ